MWLRDTILHRLLFLSFPHKLVLSISHKIILPWTEEIFSRRTLCSGEFVEKDHRQISQVSLRSDEAGCYHNNFLLAVVTDAGKLFGLTVTQYDFSEPQYGKMCAIGSFVRWNQRSDNIAVRETTFSLQRTCVQRSTNVLFEAQLPAFA